MRCSLFYIFVCFLSIIGWFISFVCLLISYNTSQRISWYTIGFESFLVLFSCTVLWTNTSKTYFPVILTFIAVSLSNIVKEIDHHFAKRTPISMAIGFGYFLLMITQMIWIFQFGIQQEFTSESNDCHNRMLVTSPYRNDRHLVTFHNNLPTYPLPSREREMPSLTETQNTVYLSSHANYSIPVTAIHNYERSKTDPNELSFSKGEVMFVYQKLGYWWQAKKSNGEIGVIPSNYVRLHTTRDASPKPSLPKDRRLAPFGSNDST